MKQIINMTHTRSTKNTHVYVDTTNDAPIPVLYIKKDALPTEAPTNIQVTVNYDN